MKLPLGKDGGILFWYVVLYNENISVIIPPFLFFKELSNCEIFLYDKDWYNGYPFFITKE